MPPEKDEAIVLRHLDFSETSQVIACLTRAHGPRRLIAKGIKRGTGKGKPSSIIDLLERGEVVFIVKTQGDAGLSILTEWRQIDAHLALRRDLRAWYAAQYAAEITAAMTEEADPHPELYDALAGLLSRLGEGGPALMPLAAYQCGLLTSTGFWPDLTRCVSCDRPAPPGRAGYYAAAQGGLICRQCEPQIPGKRFLAADLLGALRERRFNEVQAAAAFPVLDETIANAVGRPMAVARMIEASL